MKQAWVYLAAFTAFSLTACGAGDESDSRALSGRAAASGTPRAGTAGPGGFAGNPISSGPAAAGTFAAGNMPNALPLACTGLQCQQHVCPTGSTTITGRIYDPAGKNPLYNVAAYIPNSPPMPLPSGASCDPCEKLYTGNPIVTALTDATGKFTIEKAPDGPNIPLVIQIGKWRRQFVLPNVLPCQ